MVMRVGGVAAYDRLRPVFLGMVFGETFAVIFWMIVKIVLYALGREGLAIALLPL